MVGAYDGIACLKQRLDNGTKVGCSLAAVAEPCAAIDVDDHWIGRLLLLGQIDVASVEGLIIPCIIDIFPLLGCFQLHLGHLETAEAAGGLCRNTNRTCGE